MKSLLVISAALLMVLPVMVVAPPQAESTIDVPVQIEAERLTEKA